MFPLNLTDEASDRTNVEFLSNVEIENIRTCQGRMNIETDLTFYIQRDNSYSSSTIKYHRLDTNKTESFTFEGGTNIDHTNVTFDGKT